MFHLSQPCKDDWNTFPCHKTTTFAEDGDYQPTQREQHCAGAMLVLEKQGRPNIPMRFARMQDEYHPNRLSGWEDVYNSLDEFAIAEDAEDWEANYV